MKRLKQILRRLFCLPPLPTVLIAVPSFVLVFVMLGSGSQSILSYVSYLLSAYALIISATGRSAWFVSLAVYYVLLSAMRALLVRYVHRNPVGKDIPAELRRYRLCGVILLFMNQALVGIVFYMVYQNRGFFYPGLLIYAMAAYTFYITILAIVNVIRYRRRGAPILSAMKVISLTAALVSMLSLESAMLAQFGADEPAFRRVMTSASGGAVCMLVLAMALYMIIRSGRQLRQLRDTQPKA